MAKLDPIYILKLINASEILTPEQKVAVKGKLPIFSVPDIVQLQNMLEKEQNINKSYYDKVADIRKRSADKQVRIIYENAEAELREKEADILADLDAELWALED